MPMANLEEQNNMKETEHSLQFVLLACKDKILSLINEWKEAKKETIGGSEIQSIEKFLMQRQEQGNHLLNSTEGNSVVLASDRNLFSHLLDDWIHFDCLSEQAAKYMQTAQSLINSLQTSSQVMLKQWQTQIKEETQRLQRQIQRLQMQNEKLSKQVYQQEIETLEHVADLEHDRHQQTMQYEIHISHTQRQLQEIIDKQQQTIHALNLRIDKLEGILKSRVLKIEELEFTVSNCHKQIDQLSQANHKATRQKDSLIRKIKINMRCLKDKIERTFDQISDPSFLGDAGTSQNQSRGSCSRNRRNSCYFDDSNAQQYSGSQGSYIEEIYAEFEEIGQGEKPSMYRVKSLESLDSIDLTRRQLSSEFEDEQQQVSLGVGTTDLEDYPQSRSHYRMHSEPAGCSEMERYLAAKNQDETVFGRLKISGMIDLKDKAGLKNLKKKRHQQPAQLSFIYDLVHRRITKPKNHESILQREKRQSEISLASVNECLVRKFVKNRIKSRKQQAGKQVGDRKGLGLSLPEAPDYRDGPIRIQSYSTYGNNESIINYCKNFVICNRIKK